MLGRTAGRNGLIAAFAASALALVTLSLFTAPALAAPLPVINTLTLSPASVSHSGGSVTLKAKVTHASSCRVSSSPSLSGLPSNHSCSSGHLSLTLHVGAAPTAAPRHFTVTLKASGSGHSASKTVHLTQKGELPSVSGFAATPTSLTDAGGSSDLKATLAHASSCKLTATPSVSGLPIAGPCTAAGYSENVTLPANTTTTAVNYKFTLSVTGPGGTLTVSTHPSVSVSGKPAPISSISASSAPLPANASTGENGNMTFASISCAAAEQCAAVGSYYGTVSGTPVAQLGLIETLSGTTWTAIQAPSPSDISTTDPDILLNSVSCWAAGSCVAVGEYFSTNEFEPYVATLSGGVWTAQTTTTPIDTDYPQYRLNGDLNSVSCNASGVCAAVGTYRPPDNESALIEVPGTGGVDGGWDGIAAPLPGDARAIGYTFGDLQNNYLNQVSCDPAGDCLAGGGYVPNSGDEEGLAETESGGTWAPVQAGGPPVPSVGYDKFVTCATTQCVSTGQFIGGSTDIQPVTDNSGTWAFGDTFATPVPAPNAADGAQIQAIACASDSFCLGVGQYYVTDTTENGEIDYGSGSSYSAVATPSPTDANTTNPDIDLYAVSCGGASGCVAFGTYRQGTSGTLEQLIETGSNIGASPTWTASAAPGPIDFSSVGSISGISCVAGWGCVAIGSYTNTSDGGSGELLSLPL